MQKRTPALPTPAARTIAPRAFVPHTLIPHTLVTCAFAACTLAACTLAACADDDALTLTPTEEWTAEPEYQFGDQTAGDVLFGRIRDVRPAADGSRVYVLDSQSMEATIWTPDGTLIGRAGGPGQGPGEFVNPGPLILHEDRFLVGDIGNLRYTAFTLDGEVVSTHGFPPAVGPPGTDIGANPVPGALTTFQVMTMFEDGSVGALGNPEWVLFGELPEDSDPAVAVLRASQDGGVWGLDTLGLLSFRDVYSGAQRSFIQPWIRPDHYQMDPWNGSVVISRPLRGQGGRLELIDISIAGDTLWKRQIQLPLLPVTDDDIEATLDAYLGEEASPRQREEFRGAVVVPTHWHAANEVRLMTNGEIWFQQAGRDGVWYAVRQGDDDAPIRNVVLPERFRPLDANATHVWGVQRDDLDVEFVAGLRLARAGG